MLVDHLPSDTSLEAKFLDNFRRRGRNYLTRKGNNFDLTDEDATQLVDPGKVKADEDVELNDPFLKSNFAELLRNAFRSPKICNTFLR